MPFSRLRKQFSIITMASSTTKPTEHASAISDRLSMEKPAHHIMAQVPASASGTVTPAAIVVAARRRNTNTTIITSAMAASSVSCMSDDAGADHLGAVGWITDVDVGRDESPDVAE